MAEVPTRDELVLELRRALARIGKYIDKSEARAILDAVLPLVVGWQPIQTAPRVDGARYLVTGGPLDAVHIARWNERVGCWNVEDGDTLDDTDHEPDGYSRPRLWMNLPAPLLCEDCPPTDYPTDKTRCTPCPRRTTHAGLKALGEG